MTQFSLALIASVCLYSPTEDIPLIPENIWRNIETFGMSSTDRYCTNLERKACEALCRVKNNEELAKEHSQFFSLISIGGLQESLAKASVSALLTKGHDEYLVLSRVLQKYRWDRVIIPTSKPRIRETPGGRHRGRGNVNNGHGRGRGRNPQGEGNRGHAPRDEGGQGRGRDFQDEGRQDQRRPQDLPNLPDWRTNVFYLRVPSHIDEDYDDIIAKWPESYKSFITLFRRSVAPDTYGEGCDIRIMSETADTATIQGLYKLVLYFEVEKLWIALLFRLQDLYLIGFKNQHAFFECSDRGYGFNRLGFESHYKDLAFYAKSSLLGIKFGVHNLTNLVNELQRFRGSDRPIIDKDIARALLISAIMFSEAARFSWVFTHIMESDFEYTALLPQHGPYLKNWAKLSKLIIAAHEQEDLIHTINDALKSGAPGLSFSLPNYQAVTTIEDVRSMIMVMSRQSIDDSIRLVLALKDEVDEVAS